MRKRRANSFRGLAGAGLLAGLLVAGSALAQQNTPTAAPGGHATPRPDQLEPGVDTTKSAPMEPAPASSPAAAPAAAERTAATPTLAAAPAAAPTRAAAAKGTAAPAPKSAAAGRKGPDRLELDTTAVKGNRELPRVMYVVPWKRSDLGDLVGRPVNSLLDEVLQPVDRDVFKRENRYYDALQPEATGPRSDAAQGSGVNP